MKQRVFRWLILLLVQAIVSSVPLWAQTARGPEQDCFNALPVRQPVLRQQLPYSGIGTLPPNLPEFRPGAGCLMNSEENSVWYRLDIAANGSLGFVITPNDPSDIFNWAVYRIPSGMLNGDCGIIRANSQSLLAACRIPPVGAGPTGLLDTSVALSEYSRRIAVRQGETYVLYIGSPTGRAGFTLDFSVSSAGVIANRPVSPRPTFSYLPVQNVRVDNCSSVSQLTVTFSQNVLCSSVQPSSFVFTGPGGPYTITAVTSSLCDPQPNPDIVINNYSQPQTFTLTVTPALTQTGTYTLSTNATAPFPIRDVGNSPVVAPPASLLINIGNARPPVRVGGRTLAAGETVEFCLGQTRTLETDDLGSGARYEWLRQPGNIPVRALNGSLISTRSLLIDSRYQDQISGLDSTRFYQDVNTPPIVYRLRVTDPSGCVRTSDSVLVRVSAEQLPPLRVVIDSCNAVADLSIDERPDVLSYQWFLQGIDLTNAYPTARQRQLRGVIESGVYLVEVTLRNGCKNTTSAVVQLPSRSILPIVVGPSAVCEGGSIRLSLDPAQRSRVNQLFSSLQWLRDGVPIPGATDTVLVVTQPARYALQARSISRPECGIITSDSRTIRGSVAPPTPRINGGMVGTVQTNCGQPAPLAVDFPPQQLLGVDTTGFSYQWFLNGMALPGAVRPVLSAVTPGVYTVQAFNRDGCPSIASAGITVAGRGTALPTIQSGTANVMIGANRTVTVCDGDSVVLDAGARDNIDAFTSWDWRRLGAPGVLSTQQRLTVRANDIPLNVPTRFFVRVTSIDRCDGFDTVSVIRQSLPVPMPAPVLAGRDFFCTGDSLELDAGIAADRYEWTLMGSATVLGRNRRFFATRAGVYTVRVFVGTCSNAANSIMIREVQRPPIPEFTSSSGRFALCPASSLTLSVQAPPAGEMWTFQWRFNGVNIAGATTRTLVVTQPGRYNVVITNTAGCSNTAPQDRDITPLASPQTPVIAGPAVLCPGRTEILTATSPDAMTFQWFRDGQLLAGETRPMLSVNRPGAYRVRVTNANGCESFSDERGFIVTASTLMVTITTTNFGATYVANSTPTPRSFQWRLNGQDIPGATMQTFNPTAPGTYNVRVTDVNGCIDTAQSPRSFAPPSLAVVGTTVASGPVDLRAVSQNLSGAPGDSLRLVIRFTNFGSLEPGAQIAAVLRFNATLLEPLFPTPGSYIRDGIRNIPITLVVPRSTDSLVQVLPMRAALGNDSVTAIRLDSLRLLVTNVLFTTTTPTMSMTPAIFRLRNISYAGGPRLIGPPPRVRLPQSRPNPASDEVMVSYELEQSDAVTAIVMDVRGNTVKELHLGSLQAGAGEATISLGDVPSGVYYVVFRTEKGERAAIRVVVAK